MEANAEHDFCLMRLIGMFRTTKRAQYSFVPSAKPHCREDLLTPESIPYDTKTFGRIHIGIKGKRFMPFLWDISAGGQRGIVYAI